MTSGRKKTNIMIDKNLHNVYLIVSTIRFVLQTDVKFLTCSRIVNFYPNCAEKILEIVLRLFFKFTKKFGAHNFLQKFILNKSLGKTNTIFAM